MLQKRLCYTCLTSSVTVVGCTVRVVLHSYYACAVALVLGAIVLVLQLMFGVVVLCALTLVQL